MQSNDSLFDVLFEFTWNVKSFFREKGSQKLTKETLFQFDEVDAGCANTLLLWKCFEQSLFGHDLTVLRLHLIPLLSQALYL
jgi:hypothetical protein